MNDLKPKIHNEHNAQELSSKYIFKSISSNSHFSFYPDIFSNRSLSPLNINDFLENRG